MGSSSSKLSPGSGSGSQVWTISSPTSVSHDLASALQSSNETDTSRQQALELEIQARVAAELKRIRAQEAESLREATQKLSDDNNGAESSSSSSPHAAAAAFTRHTVSKEVEALRAKLAERKKVRDLPESLEVARSQVISCLRENDRRPLDCWKEVEAFKEEVRRLEQGWVDKVVR